MEEHLGAIQSMLKQDTRDLINFLDEYYPPHPINESEPLGEDCDLKKILEVKHYRKDDKHTCLIIL
jgi:hypothetical protein